MRATTSRVFWIFLVGGTLVSYLVLVMTEHWFRIVENVSYEEILSPGLAYFFLTCVWILPAQAFVTILASLFFSFFRRIPLWFVLLIMIPVCGLIVTYRDVSDRYDSVQLSDFRKLLYWTLIITPGELLCVRFIAMRKFQIPDRSSTAVGDGT